MTRRRHFFTDEERCRNMAFDLGIELEVRDGVLYGHIDNETISLTDRLTPNKMWHDAWWELRKRIANSDFRHKNYEWA